MILPDLSLIPKSQSLPEAVFKVFGPSELPSLA